MFLFLMVNDNHYRFGVAFQKRIELSLTAGDVKDQKELKVGFLLINMQLHG